RISSRRSAKCSISTRRRPRRRAAGAGSMRKPSASVKAKGGRGAAVAPLKLKARVAARPARPAGKPFGSTRGNGRPAAGKSARAREGRTGGPAQASRFTQAEPAVAASRGKYVYCIIEATDPLKFGPIGIGAEPSEVYTVHYRDLAAVVSDAPLE